MPTMLEAIGARDSAAVRRRVSLAPFLAGAGRPAVARARRTGSSTSAIRADDAAERALGLTLHQCALNVVRGERYKYVHFTKLPPLFFDLEADPGESRNLARRSAPTRRWCCEYAQKLLSWRMNHDEQTLTHLALPTTAQSPAPRRATEDASQSNIPATTIAG